MSENRTVQTWNNDPNAHKDTEHIRTQYAELSSLARDLALSAIRNRCPPQDANQELCQTLVDGTMVHDNDPVYQAWYRYFMQLQLQDSQIKNWAVRSSSNTLHSATNETGIENSTAEFSIEKNSQEVHPRDQSSPEKPATATASHWAGIIPLSYPIETLHRSTSNPNPPREQASRSIPHPPTISNDQWNTPVPPVDPNLLIQLIQSTGSGQILAGLQNIIQQSQPHHHHQHHNQQQQSLSSQQQKQQTDAESYRKLSHPNTFHALTDLAPTKPCVTPHPSPSQQPSPEDPIPPTEFNLTPPSSIYYKSIQPISTTNTTMVSTNGGNISRGSRTESLTNGHVVTAIDSMESSVLSDEVIGERENREEDLRLQNSNSSIIRPRFRTHNRDRFLVRVLRITYQCPCRSAHQTTEGSRSNLDSRKAGCQSQECRNKEAQIYVTFQAQLPAISSSFRTTLAGTHLSHATGLRLGFSSSLQSTGPTLPDFASPKVAERLDAWEQAGNAPGFRMQVLSALRDTVAMILEKIRTDGFTAITLDSDYVFFPQGHELKPAISRRRQTSASSDSSISRMAVRNRLAAIPARSMEQQSNPTNKTGDTDTEPIAYPVGDQPIWSEFVSCMDTPESPRRPRTWHQVAGSAENTVATSNENIAVGHPCPSSTIGCTGSSLLRLPTLWADGMGQTAVTSNSMTAIDRRSEVPWHKSISADNRSPGGQLQSTNPNLGGSFNVVAESNKIETGPGRMPKVLMHGMIRQSEESLSTPASPTRFLRYRGYFNDSSHVGQTSGLEKVHGSMQTAPSSPYGRSMIENRLQMAEPATGNSMNPTEEESIAAQRTAKMNSLMQEISARLQTNPTLPLVVMPTRIGTQPNLLTPNITNAPLVFQIPHDNSAFVCLPPSPERPPRVVTAPHSGTLVVIPTPSPNDLTQMSQQPLVITGPRPGYLLLITAENQFQYIPVSEFVNPMTSGHDSIRA